MKKSICLYFQVHQPTRLRLYRFFDIGRDSHYYDDFTDRTILRRIARNCYLPMNKLLLDLIGKYKGDFKVTFSITGSALEQFDRYEPEVIDSRLRALLHATFAQADDYAYVFAWVRSDAFQIKSQQEETVRTIGVTMLFDVVACPSQYTMYPDPIKGLNAWTKTVLPNAVVIGEDNIDGWLAPTREKPIIYWRLTAQGKAEQHFTHTWLDISVECHVYCVDAADRLYNLVQLNTAHALAGHIPLEDTSPLFLKTFVMQPHLNYITTGQIRASGRFGLLQPWHGKPPEHRLKPIIDVTIKS